MPDNTWDSHRLNQVVTVKKGRKVDVVDFPKDGFGPYLGAGCLSGDKPTQYGRSIGAVTATHKDVLMLWDGERSGLVGKGQDGIVSSTVAKLTPQGSLDSNFLYYFLTLKFEWIQGRRTGTGVPHVPKDLGRILQVCYPRDLDAQRRIADILSTIDEAIEHTEALIAKTQQIKAGLMHDLFTRGVLPNGQLRPPRSEAPDLYKESPLGWIPKEWTTPKLGELGKFMNGLNKPKDQFGFGYKFVNISDVYPDSLPIESMGLMNASLSEVQRYKLELGDIVVDRSSVKLDGVGYPSCLLEIQPEPILFCGFIIRLRLFDKGACNPEFACSYMRSPAFRRRVIQMATASANVNINQNSLSRLRLIVPQPDEQQRIIMRSNESDKSLRHLKETRHKYHGIKNGLMHDLLTGAKV